MKHMLEIQDLREEARRRVPKMFYDYVDTGSWTKQTYEANEQDFKRILFKQRVGRDVTSRSMGVKILGEDCTMPVALSPIGMLGMQHGNGEILAARAAERFGVPFTLSTFSICSLEQVAAARKTPFWFQLYVMKDKSITRDLIARAKKAKCSALLLTLDLAVLGERHLEVRNGLSAPPKPTLPNILNLMTKPRWCFSMLTAQSRHFGNLMGYSSDVGDMSSFSEWVASQSDSSLSWDDLDWIKKEWGGPLIVKGVLDAEDASHAYENGADVVLVSNHGGRQLDGAPSSIAALPPIADAIGGKIPIWLDGGVRSGQDVLRALALGAEIAMIGRSYIYGLGALGEAGVIRALEILQQELDRTMGLCGMTDISKASHDIIFNADPFS